MKEETHVHQEFLPYDAAVRPALAALLYNSCVMQFDHGNTLCVMCFESVWTCRMFPGVDFSDSFSDD